MSNAWLIKTASGYYPATESDHELLNKVKIGKTVKVLVRFPRNYANHERFFRMLDTIFDMQDHFEDKEIMRKWLIMRAGYFDTIVQPDMSTLFIPQSMSFDSMGEDEFQELFSKCITVAVERLDLDEPTIMKVLEYV